MANVRYMSFLVRQFSLSAWNPNLLATLKHVKQFPRYLLSDGCDIAEEMPKVSICQVSAGDSPPLDVPFLHPLKYKVGMTYKEESMKVPKSKRLPSVSNEAVKATTKLGLRKKCSHALANLHEAPVEFILTPDGVVRKEDTGPGDQIDLEKKDVLMIDVCDLVQENQMSFAVGLGITFTEEERKRVQRLVGLDQTILISFNDLEEEVAVKVTANF